MIKNCFKQSLLIELLVVIFVLIPLTGGIKASESNKVLIRNLRLIDRVGETEDQSVSILIQDEELYLVTKDEIELDSGMVGYDAQNGMVLGNLVIGKPANFLIVKEDPREDIEVLLDTKTYVVFAIREGTIIRNELRMLNFPEPEQNKKKLGWIAYTPPPMALPISYTDKSKWNRWDTEYMSGIFIAAIAIDRQRWVAQDEKSEEQVGDLKDYEGGEIRAFRFGIAGTFNFKIPLIYTFIIATHAFDKGYNTKESDDFSFLDYRLDIPFTQQIALSIGKQKEPISMERLLLGTQLPMQERPAAIDAFFTFRNVGITLNGTALNQHMSWAIGAFNDWFDDSQTFNESSSQIIGRVTGVINLTEDESHLLHFGWGTRYSNGKEEINYNPTPEFNQSPIFVETGNLEFDNSYTHDLEISWRRGPYWLSSEILLNNLDAPNLNNPSFNGYHISGSWILTGEMRSYNKRNGTFGNIPVSRSVKQGGIGAFDLTARYSYLNLNSGMVQGGKIGIISLGLNWWPTPVFGVNINYRHIILDRFDTNGSSDGIMGRVILMLE